jgi:hypothetical protein
MSKITEADRASTANFLATLPALLREGDLVGFRDENGKTVVGEYWYRDRRLCWLTLTENVFCPVRFDELLTPF